MKYEVEIKRSVIGRDVDVLKLIFDKSKNGEKSYRMREVIWSDFFDLNFFPDYDLNGKFLNLMDEPIKIDLNQIPSYLKEIKQDENLVNLIELRELNNRTFFIMGYRKLIKISNQELIGNKDEMIDEKFLSYSFQFLFGLKSDGSNLIEKRT